MKISIIGPTYPYKGGISHFTTVLVTHLRKNYDVQFISWKRQYPSFLYPVEQKDTNSRQQIKEDARFILDFFNPFSWWHAARAIQHSRSNLLILTWVTPVQAIIYFSVAFFIKRFSSTRIMYICHNVLPHEQTFYDKPLMRLAFSQGDMFMVHSKKDKEILENFIHNKKIVLAFHPLYDVFSTGEKYESDSIKKQLQLRKKILLFFGYIRPYKGVQYLIEAMSEIVKFDPEISLLIVGDFWGKGKKEFYTDLVNRLSLQDHVVFVSRYVPNEDFPKYFQAADVVVLPYIHATQSGALQIAYALDKPVLSTPVGGLKDAVIEGKTGYFIKPNDAHDIAEKVKYFYKHKISSESVAKEKERWSWDNYIKLIPHK